MSRRTLAEFDQDGGSRPCEEGLMPCDRSTVAAVSGRLSTGAGHRPDNMQSVRPEGNTVLREMLLDLPMRPFKMLAWVMTIRNSPF